MIKNRTGVDFSKHEIISLGEHMYWLKIPGTMAGNVRFTNIGGVLSVSGDYGNWIFDRMFHPAPGERVEDHYWTQKLKLSSTQNPYDFDPDGTKREILKLLAENEFEQETVTWLNDLIGEVNNEHVYVYKAYFETPNSFDRECVPHVKVLKAWLQVVFDAFDEICARLAKTPMPETISPEWAITTLKQIKLSWVKDRSDHVDLERVIDYFETLKKADA